MLQVSAAAAAADKMLNSAAAIAATVELEGRLRQVQAALRDQEQQADDAVKVSLCVYTSHHSVPESTSVIRAHA